MNTENLFQEHHHNPKACLLLTPVLGRHCWCFISLIIRNSGSDPRFCGRWHAVSCIPSVCLSPPVGPQSGGRSCCTTWCADTRLAWGWRRYLYLPRLLGLTREAQHPECDPAQRSKIVRRGSKEKHVWGKADRPWKQTCLDVYFWN